MQQRQLRLGDIVDDYCPRERRVTNHAIVAMVEQEVKQTRCTTCDAEHEYKAAKVPPQRKKKEAPAALYKQVLSDVTKPESPGAILARHNGDPRTEPPAEAVAAPAPPPDPPPAAPLPVDAPEPGQRDDHEEEGPVHRPLIRATLPRPEGQTPTRPTPEFTFRQMTRPGRFRPANGRGPHRQNRPHGHGQGQHGQTRSAGSGGNVRGGNRPPSPHGRGPSPHGPHAGGRHGAHGKKRSK
jgi:hypothetical protein